MSGRIDDLVQRAVADRARMDVFVTIGPASRQPRAELTVACAAADATLIYLDLGVSSRKRLLGHLVAHLGAKVPEKTPLAEAQHIAIDLLARTPAFVVTPTTERIPLEALEELTYLHGRPDARWAWLALWDPAPRSGRRRTDGR